MINILLPLFKKKQLQIMQKAVVTARTKPVSERVFFIEYKKDIKMNGKQRSLSNINKIINEGKLINTFNLKNL